MTILSDKALRYAMGLGRAPYDWEGAEQVEPGSLEVGPIDPDMQIQPASIDLRIGPDIVRLKKGLGITDLSRGFSDQVLMPSAASSAKEAAAEEYWSIEALSPASQECGFTLDANEFLIASTIERVKIPPNMLARVEGRSSVGRMGVAVHVTAGFIDPGFAGQITLELRNLSGLPIWIPVGHRICQLVVEMLCTHAARPYGHKELGSRFQNQVGPVPVRSEDE